MGNLQNVLCPEIYGLNSDPLFVDLRKEFSKNFSIKLPLTNGNGSLVIQSTMRLAGFELPYLVPLCGVAESILPSSELEKQPVSADVARFLKSFRQWESARLPSLSETALRVLSAELAQVRIPHRKQTYNVWVIAHDSYDQYLAARGKDFRRKTKKEVQIASQMGINVGAPAAIEEWQHLYQARHPRMSSKISHDYSVTPEFIVHLGRLIQEYRSAGRCIEVALRKDSKVVAAGLTLIHADTAYFFQTAHDPALEKYSPGKVLFLKMIEEIFQHGFKFLTFMGSSHYLRIFTSQAIPRHEIEAFRSSPAGLALYAYRTYRKVELVH